MLVGMGEGGVDGETGKSAQFAEPGGGHDALLVDRGDGVDVGKGHVKAGQRVEVVPVAEGVNGADAQSGRARHARRGCQEADGMAGGQERLLQEGIAGSENQDMHGRCLSVLGGAGRLRRWGDDAGGGRRWW
ncbi:MAG TPA: hypothetical protein DD420_26290 [Streptomyces sp.]|nr:hypothetical protein [Streptomyces sp.]